MKRLLLNNKSTYQNRQIEKIPMKELLFLTVAVMAGSFYFHYNYSKKRSIKKYNEVSFAEPQDDSMNGTVFPRYSRASVKENQRQLIITVGFGYTHKDINIFFTSLSKTNYKGEKLIFIHESVDQKTLKYLEKRSVKYILIKKKWPYFSNKSTHFKLSFKTISEYVPKYPLSGYHKFSTVRHFLINALLIEYKNKYDMILLIDSRDVYFQLNPFSWNIRRGISLFEESREKRIYEQPINNEWVESLNYSYEKVKNNYIINGGAIFYTPSEGIKFYKSYRTFFDIVKENNPIDQAMINIMIYDHYYNGRVNIYSSVSTPVRNLGLAVIVNNTVKMNSLKKMYNNVNNIIYNDDKSIPVIIHQYDRLKDLVEICKRKYSSIS